MPQHDTDLLAALSVTNSKPKWIRAGWFFDARTRAIHHPGHLVYDAEKIHYAGKEPPPPGLQPRRQGGEACTEMPEFTLLPPWIDAHTHIFLEGGELDNEKRKELQAKPAQSLLQDAIERLHALAPFGITAIRDGGDKDLVGLSAARMARSGELAEGTPRVFSPGAGIHRKGRYGKFFSTPVEDYENPTACVDQRNKTGVDHIKIVPTGIINFSKGRVTAPPQMNTEEIRSIVRKARQCGLHVMAHASGTEGIQRAIDGGVKTIEHGYFITSDQLKQMRDSRIYWVPTFAPVRKQIDLAEKLGWSRTIVDHLKEIVDSHMRMLQRAVEWDVPILIGSDAGSFGVPHGDGFFYEMESLERAGMPVKDILYQASFGNHEFLAAHTPRPPSGPLLDAGAPSRFVLTRAGSFQSIQDLRCSQIAVIDGRGYACPSQTATGL